MFEVALENLRSIQRVGIVDRMDDFLEMLRRAEGWSIEQTPHENRTSDRPKAQAHDEETLELIREHNRWDALLYQEARALFEKDWAEVAEHSGARTPSTAGQAAEKERNKKQKKKKKKKKKKVKKIRKEKVKKKSK
eukprot:TRINITY_DN32201_c0_g2_i4.p4 TRINITY_DN32201_c0_g2~~TRINITY_DN32201_c0_g2_i4.p4  ORF type:complete len:148 (+),score=31.75 TRINITY_DN32201_c0_g2_i4:38-445(+)